MKVRLNDFVHKCDFEHNSPRDFLTSQWQREEKSFIYVCYRWIIASFFAFSFTFSLTTSIERGEMKYHFIYLTNQNFFLSTILTLVNAILVTLYYQNKLNVCEKMSKPLKVYWFLSIYCTTYAILISIVYWSILFNAKIDIIDLNNVLIHITNSCVLLIDVFVVKHQAKYFQFVWPVIFGCGYAIFTFIYPLFGGTNR